MLLRVSDEFLDARYFRGHVPFSSVGDGYKCVSYVLYNHIWAPRGRMTYRKIDSAVVNN